MDGWIKQSTAFTFQMGPYLDSSDGVTPEPSLTIAAASVLLSKNGGAFASKNDATALTGTGDSHGYYDCVLNTTDTNTLGPFKAESQIAGALPVWHTFQIIPANVYDSLVAGSDALQVHANEITAGLITAAAIADNAIDLATFAADVKTGSALKANVETVTNNAITAAAIADGAIDAATFAAGAINAAAIADGAIDAATFNADVDAEIATMIWNAATASYGGAGTYGQAVEDIVADTNELQADDYPTSIAAVQTTVDAIEAAVITNAAGADIAADIIAVKAETALIVEDTNELQTDDYPTSIAAVQTTVDAIEAAVITNAAGADIAADIIAIKAETALIVEDTNELQTDDYPTSIAAVKSDTAAILTDTGTTLDGKADQLVAACITNAAGADIAADIIAVKAETALIVEDTNELQTDDYPTSIAAIKSDTEDILTDTAEIGAAGAGLTAVWDVASAITMDFGTLMERSYQLVSNKMTVVEATGAVALRNIGDTGDIATGEVVSNAGTTSRDELSWA